jgi:hypothetical protein
MEGSVLGEEFNIRVNNAIFVPTSKGAPLRNYFFTKEIVYHATYSGGDFQVFALGGDDEDLAEQIAITNANLVNSIPDVVFDYPGPAHTVYWLLDKKNFLRIWKDLQDFFVTQTLLASPPLYDVLINPKQSPRYTGWKDVDNVRRDPAPSDKRKRPDFRGAAGLVEALQGLLKLASDLTAMKEVRKAGIVLYAYSQVIKQVWSITQAIQYLIDNRITATI